MLKKKLKLTKIRHLSPTPSVHIGDPSIIRQQKNKTVRQAPGSVNRGWAKLWVQKCVRKKCLSLRLYSKNRAEPIKSAACPQSCPCQHLYIKVSFLNPACVMSVSKRPITDFLLTRYTKHQTQLKTKGCDEELLVG